MPKHKSKMHKFFGTCRFPNLSNNQNSHTGVFMKMPAVLPGCRCTLWLFVILYALMCGVLPNQKNIYTKQLESLITKSNNIRWWHNNKTAVCSRCPPINHTYPFCCVDLPKKHSQSLYVLDVLLLSCSRTVFFNQTVDFGLCQSMC